MSSINQINVNGTTYGIAGTIGSFALAKRSSDAAAISLASNTITQVPLASFTISHSDYSFQNGGVKVSETGKYLVLGSVYESAVQAANYVGCYIFAGTGVFSTSTCTEQTSVLYPKATTAAFNGTCQCYGIVDLSANDIVYLCARIRGSTGSVESGNTSPTTFLGLIRIG